MEENLSINPNEEQLNPNHRLFLVANEGATFYIGFDYMFDHEKLAAYNLFNLTSKRNFKNLADEIENTYYELFTNEDGSLVEDSEIVMLSILSAQTKLMTAEQTNITEFYELIDKICYNGENTLLRLVHNFVENHYSLNLDEITTNTKQRKKTVNKELLIKDAHAKIYLEISYLSRVLIPVISNFYFINKANFPVKGKQPTDEEYDNEEPEEELIFDEINSAVFEHIFDIVAKKKANALRNKLYKLCISRINTKVFSANRYWNVANNLAITPETEAREIWKKLLTNSITKIVCDPDLNIVSFFQSVINNQVDFLFQNKFKYKLQILDYELNDKFVVDDNNMSEYEKIEIRMARKNEGSLIISNISINEIVDNLPQELNVPCTEEEVRDCIKFVHNNLIQEKILNYVMLKYFDDIYAMKRLNAYQYAKVLVCVKKYLEAHKFVLLPKILTAKCEKHRERVGITGNKIKEKIRNAKKYSELFDKKYNSFKEEIEKPLSSIIGTVYCSIFKDENNNELFDSSIKVGNIAEELVDLAWLI